MAALSLLAASAVLAIGAVPAWGMEPMPPAAEVNATLAKLFVLFEAPSCSAWAEGWEADTGVFLHPLFPDGLQGDKLVKMCEDNHKGDAQISVISEAKGKEPYFSLFRQDGSYMYTNSLVHTLLLPYVYAAARPREHAAIPFANSGWELVQMRRDSTGQLKFKQVVEFFSRMKQPYTFSPDSAALSTVASAPHAEINASLALLFSLFEVPKCESWAAAWAEDGDFLHPAFPEGLVGHAALVKMCKDIQAGDRQFSVQTSGKAATYRSMFRQDGPYMYTESGGIYSILLPYIYSTLRLQSDGSFSQFSNSGWEFCQLKRQADGSLKFISVVEFWTRTSAPFHFNPDYLAASASAQVVV